MYRIGLMAAICCAAGLACGGTTMPACNAFGPPPMLGGPYAYEAKDANGTAVLQGLLLFPYVASTGDGTWSIAWKPGVDTTQVVGPQVGQGRFTRDGQDGQITIDLTPDNVDNNIGLEGCYADNGVIGSWHYVGIAGEIASGAFTLFPALD